MATFGREYCRNPIYPLHSQGACNRVKMLSWVLYKWPKTFKNAVQN